MRLFAVSLAALALAGPGAAATPRFALFDLQSDLAHTSRNAFGDVDVKSAAALRGHGALVRCGTWCRFGDGWLAFSRPPHLVAADVAAASVRYTKRQGWTVRLTLRSAAQARWSAFERGVTGSARLHGVPDVLVVVAGGQIAASPFATQVSAAKGTVVLTGFGEPAAKALAKLLR